jgi:hypothetical protein
MYVVEAKFRIRASRFRAHSRAKAGDQREVLAEAFALLLALGADAGSRPADVLGSA